MAKKLNKLGVENSLWNNIRANKGSGKAPTKEMLKQERKINAKYAEGGTTDKPKFPGKLETTQSDNTRVLNTEGRTVANSKLQDQYNKNEIIQYGTNKGKPYGFENQTIRGGMESLVTPDNVMMATGVAGLAKAGAKALGRALTKEEMVNLYRIQEKGGKTFAQNAAEGRVHPLLNKPEALARKANEEKYFGQWFTKDKNDLNFYSADREFVNPEMINLKVPASKLSQFQNYDKMLSRAPEREFVIPQDMQKLYKHANGGRINPGFNALPQNVQQKILAKMAMGGPVLGENMYGMGGYLPMHADGDYVGNAPALPQANFNIQNPRQVTPNSFMPNANVAESSGYNRNVMPINTNVVGIGANAPMANTLNNSTTSEIMQTGPNRGKVNINPETGNPVGGVNSLITPGNMMLARGATRLAYGVGKDIAKSAANAINSTKHHGKHFGAEELASHGYDHLTHMFSGGHGAIPQGAMYNSAIPSHSNGGMVTPKYRYSNGRFLPMHEGTVGSGTVVGTPPATKFEKMGGMNMVGAVASPLIDMASNSGNEKYLSEGERNVQGVLGTASDVAIASMNPIAIAAGLGVKGAVALYNGLDLGGSAAEGRAKEKTYNTNVQNTKNIYGVGDQSIARQSYNNNNSYAHGGMTVINRNHPNPQEEVEGGESAMLPSGKNVQFNGPKHTNGGIKTSLPEGTRIFSDQLIYPGKR